ncbi:DNA polymerase/3'-5' exonuclease PolX [Virgibacillus sp. W0181]|uniref:DNA polymerase/3'-5' exonuclease PolX n=1 Tax=Virgibacillus sp. W0181 TaxID=3391581 RepID=UPI003F46D131
MFKKNKKDVIKLLETIAIYLELKGENPFKISAYRKAAQALERDERSLADIDDFTKIKGVGKGTNTVIMDYLQNNESETLNELEQEIPAGLIALLQLPGLGGKKIAKLYQDLGVVDATSLKEACESGQVEKLAGFGVKTSKNILQALSQVNERPERLPVAIMLPAVEKIEMYLDSLSPIKKYSLAGSLRRMKEQVRDIDFIIATEQPEEVRQALLEIKNIKTIISSGLTKVSIVLEEAYDVNVDFRLVTPYEYATTLHHFTGSKEHNVGMRQLAKARGEKINEYGIEIEESNEIITFDSEQEFFNHFGLQYIPPELRENRGELDAFTSAVNLVERNDIRGDLHMHTTWSDGAQSVEEMVNYAREIGYEYIAITDHSKFLRVANGLNETRLRKQREEIERLNAKYDDIHVFAGVEMDILPDGTLDFSTEFLRELDFVIGAIHSGFNQSEEKIMYRLYTALENPFVQLIAHPTGRLIGRRDGYAVNVEQLIERAVETNTALEINANPNRLDLSAEWATAAQQMGATIAINTDAHNYNMFSHMDYGVRTAKRGWVKKETVLNTWEKDHLINYFNRHK